MSTQPVLVLANLGLLEQAAKLIERMPGSAYAPGSAQAKPVGPHFRHVLEHYSCFVAGLPGERVNYDARAREEAIESDRAAALSRIAELRSGLTPLREGDLDRPVSVRLECGEGGEEQQWSRSTLRRELQFLLSHTIHHFALIGLLLERHGVDPGEEFGVAPSTLKHWRSQAECAPRAG